MRIALVDPSRAVQRIMTGLVACGEHDVLAFSEGQKALDYIRADETVRALITSVQLGDMSGIQLCAAARTLAGSRRALFIIVMSSTEDYGLVVKALDNGADDFIRKPPFPEELRARVRAADRLTMMQRELIKLASTDSLSGLLNRRAFFERAEEACQVAESGKSLSAIMFDIDRFKFINDTRGHEAGDAALRNLGAIASTATEIVGRLGGEEFCLLEHCELAEEVNIAEKLRRSIAALQIPQWQGLAVTCSFGVAEWKRGDTIDSLLRRADLALYEAKNRGRDRVVGSDAFNLSRQHNRWRGVTRSGKRRTQ